MSEALLALCAQYGDRKTYAKGQLINQRGDSFGEVTLLVNQPHTHHSEADSDVVITHLNRQQFNWMNENVPEFNTYLLTSLAIKLEQWLNDHLSLLPVQDDRLPTTLNAQYP